MERQVVLTGKNKRYNKKKVNAEIITIEKMLPYIESFEAFCDNTEVFDTSNQSVVKNRKKLFNLYMYGWNDNASLCISSRN